MAAAISGDRSMSYTSMDSSGASALRVSRASVTITRSFALYSQNSISSTGTASLRTRSRARRVSSGWVVAESASAEFTSVVSSAFRSSVSAKRRALLIAMAAWSAIAIVKRMSSSVKRRG